MYCTRGDERNSILKRENCLFIYFLVLILGVRVFIKSTSPFEFYFFIFIRTWSSFLLIFFIYSTHWYETVRYLNVPLHGSPKTPFFARILHSVLPLHFSFAAWQFVSLPRALLGQTSSLLWVLPYDALRTTIFVLVSHFSFI